MRLLLSVAAGYLVGSVLSADIASFLARRSGIVADLRSSGSGNPGAANAMTHLGKGWGIAIMVGDIAKGLAAALIGQRLAGANGAYAAGAAAVAGHCYPLFHRFRGGKGVATSVGTTLMCFPIYVPVDVGIAVAGYTRTRHAGAATLVASGAWVAASTVWWLWRLPNAWGPKPTAGLPAYAFATTAIIASRFANDGAQPAPTGEDEP